MTSRRDEMAGPGGNGGTSAAEDDVILAKDDMILDQQDEPVAAGRDPATPGERGTVPASTDPADDLAADSPAGRAAEPATPGPAGRETATAEPAEAGGIPAAAVAEQQWPQIMALFVDDPHGSVERAAAAASEVAAALTASLEREQERLRASWRDNASTEDLRTALQQYRAFCGRLEGLG
jgi:hypothetical protein